MKLYMVPLAPNPTKVMLYIAERAYRGTEMGIEQIVVNTVKGRHREPEHIARNPFGTLPVLELDNGAYIIESLSIILYLEEMFPDGAVLTGDALARAKALEMERTVELRISKFIGAYVHATKSPLDRPSNPTVARDAEANLQIPLDYLEGQLADDRPFLTGRTPSLADFTLQPGFQFLRFVDLDLIGDRPLLRAWDERFRSQPAAQAVLKW
jgi:glutathione S-transferase